MFRALFLGILVLLAGSQIGIQPGWSAEQTEQAVQPIAPRGEQDVRSLTAPAEQRVDQVAVGGGGVEQQVAPQVPPSGAAKVASTATKVVVVAATVAVSLGSAAAMVLFL